MIPRPYQAAAIENVLSVFPRRPILCQPTGSGKTFVAVEIIKRLQRKTLFLAHRRELVQQAGLALTRAGATDVGYIMAGCDPSPRAQIQVASIQTLARRGAPGVGLVVVDEVHHCMAPTWQDALAQFGDAWVMGMSATPWRMDGRGLGDLFDEIVVGARPAELCADGTLLEPVVYVPAAPDMSGVHITAGDYRQDEIGTIMQKRAIVGDVVEQWKRRALGRRTLGFAVHVEHSMAMVKAFREAGIVAEHLDGKTAVAVRDGIWTRLRSGATPVVWNCMVATEGLDIPQLEVAIIARPTASLNLHLQMLGRIMRAADGKGGSLVLDHAGNHLRLGPVTQHVEYSLDDTVGRGTNGAGAAPMKRCPDCYLLVVGGTAQCPECGHVFKSKEIATKDGDLTLFGAAPARQRPTLGQQQAAWEALEGQRLYWNRKPGWSFYRFEERFGFRPLVYDGMVCDPATVGGDVRAALYGRWAALGREKGFKDGFAAATFKSYFGRWPTEQERRP